jgi:hypothetical protein
MLTRIVSRLRMSGVTPLLHVYAFMRWTGTPYRNHPGPGGAIVQVSACETVQKAEWHWDGFRSGYFRVRLCICAPCSHLNDDIGTSWSTRSLKHLSGFLPTHPSSKWSVYLQKNVYSLLGHACYMPRQYQTPRTSHGTYRQINLHKMKLSVYHPGVFTKLNKMVFTSQTHLLIIVLNVLFGQHVSTGYWVIIRPQHKNKNP